MTDSKPLTTDDLLQILVDAGIFKDNITLGDLKESYKDSQKLSLGDVVTPSYVIGDSNKYVFIIK